MVGLRRFGMPSASPAAALGSERFALALTLLFQMSVGVSTTAHAHGAPPALRGVLRSDGGQPVAVAVNRGLAVQEGGKWRYVCPSQWAGPAEPPIAADLVHNTLWVAVKASELRAPANGEPPAPQHLAGDAVHLLDAGGQWLRKLALPWGQPVALASSHQGPVVLGRDASSAALWEATADATALQLLAALPEPAVALAEQADLATGALVWTGHLKAGQLVLRATPRSAGAGPPTLASLDLPVALADAVSLTLAAQDGALWAVVQGPAIAEVALLRAGDEALAWRTVYAGTPPLQGPVVAADAVWLVQDGRLGRVAMWPGGPASGSPQLATQPFASLDRPDWFVDATVGLSNQLLATTRTQLLQWPAATRPEVSTPDVLFSLNLLQPPNRKGLAGSLDYGCWLEWQDLAADAGLAAGQVQASSDPAQGSCAARRRVPTATLAWLTLSPLVVLWLRQRRRAAC